MIKYILDRSAFNRRELARLSGWNPTSMHQWLIGTRPIPANIRKNLAAVLQQYGYQPKPDEQ